MLSGEGVGVVVLKRLADAERDKDRIYAVIQGIGLASDGKSQGLAAPSARGHARAMRRAYRRAKIDPATVMLVEGHGLGVPAADRAELRALKAVFPTPFDGKRTLGAVSSIIGHAMPAAGIAGLIKTSLALYHRVLPPTLHADNPHPLLNDPASPFALIAAARPWIHADEDTPRRAGVNAFGFAGINAHAVLEEHAPSADGFGKGAFRRWDTEAILFSARDRSHLIEQARELLSRLKDNTRYTLLDVAYSQNSRRDQLPGGARLGLVASSIEDLAVRLAAVLPRLADPACRSIRDGRGVYFWDEPLLGAGPAGLAFLFPGEGSQYPGMLADLCIHFPEVRRLFDTADRIARDLGESVPPSEHLFGGATANDEKLWSAATAVNIVLNAQWALYQVLIRLGLQPDAVLGHSSGELLALSAAGVFETDRALERRLGKLGAIMSALESSGDLPAARLVAVAAHRDRVETLCRDAGVSGVDVAIDNCPHQVVLAVPSAELKHVLDQLRTQSILWEELPFSRAYHTPSFLPAVGPIAEFFDQMSFRSPRVAVYSCASRARMPGDPGAVKELAIAQWTQTVAFRETIEAMHADGLRLFIDVGARGNLAGFVEDTLRGKPAFAVAANLPRRSGLTQLNHLVAATFAQGASVKTDYLYARRAACAIDWHAAEPSPRAFVELKIGFPEMHLSAPLVKRLQSSALPPSPVDPRDPVPESESSWTGTIDRQDHAHKNGNGVAHDDHRVVAWPQPARAKQMTVEAVELPAMTSLLDYNGRFDHESCRNVALPSAVDDAMLSFQQTMQQFLHTQRDVIGVYLGATIDDQFPSTAHFDRTVPSDHSLHPIAHGNGSVTTSTASKGPWAGEVRKLVAGMEVETLLVLEAYNDPVAQHHTLGGRKVSAVDPSLLGLPVVPFAVMAEMAAQVAGLIVDPGQVIIGLKQVCAHRWVRYEEQPVYLELRGHRLSSADDDRVWVSIFNRGTDGNADAPRPVFEATAVFGKSTPLPPPAAAWSLADPRPSKFTAFSVYDEQWLFHGPFFQAIDRMGKLSRQGIEGGLRVLPLEHLIKRGQDPLFHTDLIVIDNFTQLLGAWGLDYLAEGDVMFPLRMDDLEIYGERPPVGAEVACRINIDQLERHRVRAQAEFIRPDGTVWMRIRDWEDWRFHWPGRFRDAFRQPRDHMVGEELPLNGLATRAKAVWLEPPADMGRPVWRDVLEHTQLGPRERATYLAERGSDQRRSQRLWGRIAAKEAARRLWNEAGEPATYPADLAIVAGEHGRPLLTRLGHHQVETMPAVSIAHTDGIAVALAALDPDSRVGIDVEPIVERDHSFLAAAFTPGERALLDRRSGSNRAEWTARFWCAKEAAAKASGLGLAGGPSSAEVVEVDVESGAIQVRLTSELASAWPEGKNCNPLRVVSARRGEHVWAWTIGTGAKP